MKPKSFYFDRREGQDLEHDPALLRRDLIRSPPSISRAGMAYLGVVGFEYDGRPDLAKYDQF
jgi:hypothetical protein